MSKTPVAGRTAAKSTMCVVRIGIDNYMLPSTKGLALIDLLSHAVICRETFRRDTPYTTGGTMPDLSLTMVMPSQVKTVPAEKFDPHYAGDSED